MHTERWKFYQKCVHRFKYCYNRPGDILNKWWIQYCVDTYNIPEGILNQWWIVNRKGLLIKFIDRFSNNHVQWHRGKPGSENSFQYLKYLKFISVKSLEDVPVFNFRGRRLPCEDQFLPHCLPPATSKETRRPFSRRVRVGVSLFGEVQLNKFGQDRGRIMYSYRREAWSEVGGGRCCSQVNRFEQVQVVVK